MNRRLIRELSALLYPVRCPVCGEVILPNDRFCPECEKLLVSYSGSFQVKGSAGFTAAYEYRKEMSAAVMLMKDGVMGNAPYAFGSELAERIRAAGMDGADLLIPAPLHKNELRQRSVNQSFFIAKEVGLRLGIPVNGTALLKTAETLPQKELSKRERKLNLHGAFTVSEPEVIADKTIILIDDVCTTGSTLAELTAALLGAGAKTVYCASACKTPEVQADDEKTEV
jgi:ComF family protein